MPTVLVRRDTVTGTHRGEDVMPAAETGGMRPQAQGHKIGGQHRRLEEEAGGILPYLDLRLLACRK